MLAPRDHRLDPFGWALEDGFHAAVRLVPHPSRETEGPSAVAGLGAEEHALHVAAHDDVGPRVFAGHRSERVGLLELLDHG